MCTDSEQNERKELAVLITLDKRRKPCGIRVNRHLLNGDGTAVAPEDISIYIDGTVGILDHQISFLFDSFGATKVPKKSPIWPITSGMHRATAELELPRAVHPNQVHGLARSILSGAQREVDGHKLEIWVAIPCSGLQAVVNFLYVDAPYKLDTSRYSSQVYPQSELDYQRPSF